jgi:CBS domain-containing protein
MKKLSDLMTRDVAMVTPDTTLDEVARLMAQRNVGMIPVMRDGTRIAGTVTDRDIVVRCIAGGKPARETKAGDVMSTSVLCVLDGQTAEEAHRVMQQERVRRLLVVDGDKHLVGVVSIGDLARDGEKEHLSAVTLQAVSTA